jgi:hypothetical protein
MSWKPEVIADNSGKWVGNLLRFETKEEAEANVTALMMKWTLVRDTRVVECDDPITHVWTANGLQNLVPKKVETEKVDDHSC